MANAPCIGDNSTMKHQLFCPVEPKNMPKGYLPDMALASRGSEFLRNWNEDKSPNKQQTLKITQKKTQENTKKKTI